MGVSQTGSGKWHGAVQFMGKRYWTTSFEKKSEAITAEAKLRTRLHEGTHQRTEAGMQTFDVYAKKVIERKKIKEQTRANYLRDLRLHLSPTFGHLPLRRITPSMVDDWYYSQPQIPSLKSRYNVLGIVMNHAVRKDEILKSPCRVEGARTNLSPERRLITREEFQRLCEVSTDHDRLLWTVAMIGGLRIGETLALDRTDLNMETGELSISKQWVQQHARVEEGTKNGTTRVVALPSWLVADLKTSFKRNPAVGAVPIFTNKEGRRLGRHAAWDRWVRVRTVAGVEWAHIHDLRHMGMTLFSQSPDVRIEDVAARAGHKDLRSTKAYLHSDSARQRELVERMAL